MKMRNISFSTLYKGKTGTVTLLIQVDDDDFWHCHCSQRPNMKATRKKSGELAESSVRDQLTLFEQCGGSLTND